MYELLEDGSDNVVKDKVIMRVDGFVFKKRITDKSYKYDYNEYIGKTIIDIRILRYPKGLR